jgi:hypothetical protein
MPAVAQTITSSLTRAVSRNLRNWKLFQLFEYSTVCVAHEEYDISYGINLINGQSYGRFYKFKIVGKQTG